MCGKGKGLPTHTVETPVPPTISNQRKEERKRKEEGGQEKGAHLNAISASGEPRRDRPPWKAEQLEVRTHILSKPSLVLTRNRERAEWCVW